MHPAVRAAVPVPVAVAAAVTGASLATVAAAVRASAGTASAAIRPNTVVAGRSMRAVDTGPSGHRCWRRRRWQPHGISQAIFHNLLVQCVLAPLHSRHDGIDIVSVVAPIRFGIATGVSIGVRATAAAAG